MVWPFKRKKKPTLVVSVSHFLTDRETGSLLKRSPILDRHFRLIEQLENTYTPTSEIAIEKGIEICQEMISISEQVKSVWVQQYGLNRGPGKAPGLPSHPGFKQLAIIYEKRGRFEDAIAVAKQARQQGWTGDWEKRITRCEAKLAKVRST